MKITKAVIPVAGKGTRFLPATKNISKEIIPILGKPMIHFVVEEAVNSGIEEIIFVTSEGKEEVEEYFKPNKSLENFLSKNGKEKELELIQKIGSMANIKTVLQKEQLGLGHAILQAKELVGDESFAVLLGDDLVVGDRPVTKQLIEMHERHEVDAVIGVMEVPLADVSKYGIVAGEKVNEKNIMMSTMVEKPSPESTPSQFATPGRYILPSKIFSILENIKKGAGGEYQLTDAICELCNKNKVLAHQFEGDRFDTGNIFGYIDATIEFALRDPRFSEYTKQLLKQKVEKL